MTHVMVEDVKRELEEFMGDQGRVATIWQPCDEYADPDGSQTALFELVCPRSMAERLWDEFKGPEAEHCGHMHDCCGNLYYNGTHFVALSDEPRSRWDDETCSRVLVNASWTRNV